tara:strand:+ start:517 stop:1104 length:588 start_codon:yes stop_codon:yes gene_type:complete
MKKIIAALLFISLSLLGAEPNQVQMKSLQKRGEDGNQLYYLPHQDFPFTGKAVTYWQNGRKKTEISFKDGKRDGTKTHWYASGKMLSEINYKNGKHDGLLSAWYENGHWKRTGNSVDGKMVEIWTNWYENGQMRNEANYIEGYMDSAIVWKPDGERCSKTNVNNGNGVMVMYSDQGMEWLRVTYKDGGMTHWRRP